MKKISVLFLTSVLLFCSCSFNASLNDGDINFTVMGELPAAEKTSGSQADTEFSLPVDTKKAETTASEKSDASADTKNIIENESEADAPDNLEIPEYVPIEEFVELKVHETVCGNVTYPVFNTERLDKTDAETANALFEYIKNVIDDNVKEFLELEESDTRNEPVYDLCATEYALNGNTLSVMIRYEYYYGYPIVRFRTINFDTLTGKAMPAHEVIKRACFTNEETEAALLKYTEINLRGDAQYNKVLNCFLSGILPDEADETSEDWGRLYDIVINSYRASSEPYPDIEIQGMPWETLPIYPSVYFTNIGELYVVASIPANSAGDIYNIPVAIGHDDIQTAVINHRNPYAPVCDRPYLSEQGVTEAISKLAYSEYPISCIIDEIGYIPIDPDDIYSTSCLAYIVSAAALDGGHVAEEWKFAVGMFYDVVWEMDFSANKWKLIPNRTEIFPDPTEAYDSGALGRVILEPNEYETWYADPIASAEISQDDKYFLVGSMYSDTEISILHVTVKDDGSLESDKVLFQVKLNEGEWIKVYGGLMPENAPGIAVEFATGFGKGTFYYCSPGEMTNEYEGVWYAFSDENVD